MTINANTKIATLLKKHPASLEAIVEISPKFKKLRNPILRKLIAGRTSIEMASKLGGCSVDDFFNKLQPLGFVIDKKVDIAIKDDELKHVPEFMKNIQPGKIEKLDVRPILESGKDPLNIIMLQVEGLKEGHILKIINRFEPTPLIHLLGKRGYESYVEVLSDELVNTYFNKKADSLPVLQDMGTVNSAGWDNILNRFRGNITTIDVRKMEMPLPMHAILEALETLSINKALFVYHKRIPVYLLPELDERKFKYLIKEISDDEVHLLIYKD